MWSQRLLVFMWETVVEDAQDGFEKYVTSRGEDGVWKWAGGEMYDRQTVSRAPPGPNTGPFIQQTGGRSALDERQTVKTGQEADPHYVWLYRTEIRSVCRPPSESGGDMATLTSNLQSLIWNPRRPTVWLNSARVWATSSVTLTTSCGRVEI